MTNNALFINFGSKLPRAPSSMKYYCGYLIMSAAVIIVIFAIIGAFLTSMFIRAGSTPLSLNSAEQASNLAESGLEQGIYEFENDNLSLRRICGSPAWTLTPALETGSVVMNFNNSANYIATYLNNGISSVGTPATINVSSSSIYNSFGRVVIGREVFSYKSVDSATNTLREISRAQDGSLAAIHPAGSLVTQYQCTLSSTGSSPANTPYGARTYQQALQNQVLFAVGNNSRILRWNPPANELSWESNANPSSGALRAVSAVNYHDVWIAANSLSSNLFQVVRLHGDTWAQVSISSNAAQNLYGIKATSEYEAWSVGARDGANMNILRWVRNASNASNNWCVLPCSGKTLNNTGLSDNEKDLYAVDAIDTNGDGYADIGYAVGGRNGSGGGGANRGTIMIYNGSGWAPIASMPAFEIGRLFGVAITPNSNQEAFFVGRSSGNNNNGKLLRYRNGVLALLLTSSDFLNAVSVVDTNNDGLADFGCAVGDSGLVVLFNNSGIISSGTPTAIGNTALNGVVTLSSTDIWAVGNGGDSFHYDGNSWSFVNTGVGNTLLGISGVFPKVSAKSIWHELIN